MNKNHGAEGPRDARIAIVGEAFGTKEARLLRPFVGPAGSLLDACLMGADINRQSCYITNVIKEQPKNNNIKLFINLDKKEPVETEAYRRYRELLKEELIEINPNIIIATGNVPLYTLTGKNGITKWRGSILESTLIPGKKVLPIFHPASALEYRGKFLNRYIIIADLQKAKREAEFPQIRRQKRNLIINPSFSEIQDYLDRLTHPNYSQLAFDIEVTNEQVSHISFSHDRTFAMCIPFMQNGRDTMNPEQEVQIWAMISRLLQDSKIPKLAQNIIFDSTFLFRRYGIKIAGRLEDTMIASHMIFPDFPKGLDFLTSMYTDLPYYKEDGKKHKFTLHNDEFQLYSARDSVVLPEIFFQLKEAMKKKGIYQSYRKKMELIPVLIFMQERGILLDTEGLREEKQKANRKAIELTKELQEIVGYEINPKSPVQLKDYFYEVKGFKPYVKKGKPTTDDDAMKRLARRGLKEAALIIEIRRLSKASSTYFDIGYDREDNRVRCAFRPTGTSFTRLSSAETIFGTGSNLQNIPPYVKKYFLADPGYLLYEMDLSQAENRIVAYLAEEEMMIRAFEQGIDVHSQTAALIYQKPVEEISREKGTSRINPQKSERDDGKTANHGLNYGEGYKTFGLRNGIAEKDAKWLVERYHEIYPGVRNTFQKNVREELKRSRTLTSLLGTKITFLDQHGDKLWKKGYSCIPQSTVGDIINQWGLVPIYQDQKNFKPVELLNQIHDSILFQIPVDIGLKWHEYILRLIRSLLMRELHCRGRTFIIPVDVKVGKNWLEMTELDWDKNLEDQIRSINEGE